MLAARSLCAVLGLLCRREFTALYVVCVQFGVVLPLLGQVVQRKNGGHRTNRNASTAVNALHRIDKELWDVIESGSAIIIGGVLFGWMQSTGQASTQEASFTPMQGSAIT